MANSVTQGKLTSGLPKDIRATPEGGLYVNELKEGSTKETIIRHLSSDGTASGTKNIIGNYSGAATRFYIQPPAGQVFRLYRMLIMVEDSSGFQAEEYGNLGSALSQGVTLQLATSGVQTKDLMDGVPVATNAGWGRMCYDVDLKTWGAGDEVLVARWTFANSGTLLRLDGDLSESLDVVVNDDLSGLLSHYFLVQGYIE